jgi:16S rRNA (adenine1518-N6/adenine1519-N6)-dimethyltransferase
MTVKAKKHLGQHFLKDVSICKRIADEVIGAKPFKKVLEVGPGMGALTDFLLLSKDFETHVIEIDDESVAYLKENTPALEGRIYEKDFLKTDLKTLMGEDSFAVVGNFPYNISSQILFKVLDYKDQVPLVVGMFQKEVAERIAEGPGSKKYGIISVLLQAFYDIEYLFTIPPTVFNPPPKVDSAVIRLVRNNTKKLDCNEQLFKQLVKMGFNQRRKTLRNSIKPLLANVDIETDEMKVMLQRRPETLSVAEFIGIAKCIEKSNSI